MTFLALILKEKQRMEREVRIGQFDILLLLPSCFFFVVLRLVREREREDHIWSWILGVSVLLWSWFIFFTGLRQRGRKSRTGIRIDSTSGFVVPSTWVGRSMRTRWKDDLPRRTTDSGWVKATGWGRTIRKNREPEARVTRGWEGKMGFTISAMGLVRRRDDGRGASLVAGWGPWAEDEDKGREPRLDQTLLLLRYSEMVTEEWGNRRQQERGTKGNLVRNWSPFPLL